MDSNPSQKVIVYSLTKIIRVIQNIGFTTPPETIVRTHSLILSEHILGAVNNKCPGFYKCLIFSKSGFATFSDSAGHQK